MFDPPAVLDETSYPRALAALAGQDADLALILERYGPPPMWERPPGFATLLHIILEQQVSLASARAAFERLKQAAQPLTPQRFLEFDDEQLKRIGFSRQKTRYGRILAAALLRGELDLEALTGLPDAEVLARLTAITGIGAWTANIYLLMALLRPDVWPVGDRALAVALQQVKGLERCPSGEEMAALGQTWRPWRAVAARLFWHDYLSRGRH